MAFVTFRSPCLALYEEHSVIRLVSVFAIQLQTVQLPWCWCTVQFSGKQWGKRLASSVKSNYFTTGQICMCAMCINAFPQFPNYSGVRHEHMTMIWCLSPLIGFFLTPIMGSLSDRLVVKCSEGLPTYYLLKF